MNLDWTDDWSSSSDGTILTGTHLGSIQSDLAAVLRALSDANVDPAAAIQESKILFSILTGHDHDGVNSKTIAASTFIAKHYRSGCVITRTGAGTISVNGGHVEIGGTVYNITTATTLTLATAGDYVFGSETSNASIYVYAYNNSGTLGFKLSTEAPDLSDTSDNATEAPWRYQKYSSAYYRCVGAVWNDASGDILLGSECQFDGSANRTFRVTFNGAAITLPTIWTPDIVLAWGASADSTPAAAENYGDAIVAVRQLNTDFTVNIDEDNSAFRAVTDAWAASDGGGITFTAQSAGTGGSISFVAGTAGLVAYGVAMTNTQF